MAFNISEIVTGLFKPLADLVGEIHTSVEEKMAITAAVQTALFGVLGRILDYEQSILEAQKEIIVAEAKGGSWMQRNWRPITMLTFLFLVVVDSFGFLPFRLAAEAWTLLQIGLGGYVVGRSAEKVVVPMMKALKK